MQAGKRDRRVTIWRIGTGADDGYTTTDSLAALATYWCHVAPLRGSEAIEAGGKDGQRTCRFTFLHDSVTSTITELDQLEHGGDRYAITGPALEIGRREGVEVVGVTVGAA